MEVWSVQRAGKVQPGGEVEDGKRAGSALLAGKEQARTGVH